MTAVATTAGEIVVTAQARAGRIRAGVAHVREWVEDVTVAAVSGDWKVLGYGSWDAYCDDVVGARIKLPQQERAEFTLQMRDAGMSTRAIGTALGNAQDTVRRDLASGERNRSPESAEEFVCDDCGGQFAVDVWHCNGCDHHWPLNLDECKNHCNVDWTADGGEVPKAKTGQPYDELPKVTGTDGKTYPSRPAAPAKPQRRALPAVADDAGWGIRKAAEKLEALATDDRLGENEEQVAAKLAGHLTYAIEVCQDLLDRLVTEPNGDAR